MPTHDNPADCASRGLLPSQIQTHSLWWNGPTWLSDPRSSWPQLTPTIAINDQLEASPKALTCAVAFRETWSLASRYSSWFKLLRVTAYICCFTNIARRVRCIKNSAAHLDSSITPSMALHPEEITQARIFWLTRMQAETFPDELHALYLTKTVPNSSPISALALFVDPDGLIRARGRLHNSKLSEQAKNPIILRSHPLLTLLIRDTHLRLLHAGPSLTHAKLRNEFWILRSRTTVRAVIHKCVPYVRKRAAIPAELMGDLPPERVTEVKRAFTNTGVDYAGPILVRPLGPMSDHIDDLDVLTPAHFLIGTELTSPPEPSLLHLAENRLSRWQMVHRLAENFWRVWSSDYLHTLHQRPKWRTVQNLAKVGQIVLLRNQNAPPGTWELGRITACHPGSDALVRVVTVKTARSEYTRPIAKICFLPVSINDASDQHNAGATKGLSYIPSSESRQPNT